MPISNSFILVFTNILIVFGLVTLLKPKLTHKAANTNLIIYYSLILVFCLFSFWGQDWFGYLSTYEYYHNNNDDSSHLEPFYLYLIQGHTINYLHFRLIVWGTALLFVFLAVKRLKLNMNIATYFFVITTLIWFSYGRVSLSMSIMMYGATWLTTDKSKFSAKHLVIALLLIFLSCFFHKSAIWGAAIILLSYIFLFIPRASLTILLILFPVLLYFSSGLGTYFLDLEGSEEAFDSISSAQFYLQDDKSMLGMGARIAKLLEWIPKFIAAYLCYKFIRRGTHSPNLIKLFCIIVFVNCLLSSIFLFNIGLNTDVVYSRFQRFGIIPMFIVLAYMYENCIMKKEIKYLTSLILASTFYSLIYSAYNQL